MTKQERVYGYTGGGGLIQAFAGGYFLWDLVVTVQNVRVFGVGMLFHAISALCVFSLGFVSFPVSFSNRQNKSLKMCVRGSRANTVDSAHL